MAAKWLRYSWDLDKLPEKPGKITSPLVIRPAEREELADVLKVMTSAFSMDTGWADIHKPLTEKLNAQVEAAFAEKEPLCLVVQYGNRIIGCSALRVAPDDCESNLVTGPCILHEYRSRGFGSSLLGASLEMLRAAGLRRAYGVAREKTVAARFLYPKFGGTPAACATELEPLPKLAA